MPQYGERGYRGWNEGCRGYDYQEKTMAAGIRKKLAKVVAAGTGKHGKLPQAAQKPTCRIAGSKSGVKCSNEIREEVVTSVGS